MFANNLDLVFIDVETTGLAPLKGDAVCEIGGFKFRDDTPVNKFYTLVNPQIGIPYEVSKIHNIYDEEVKDAPTFREIADKLVGFLKNSVLCGYNISFDLEFLNTELRRISYPPLNLPALDVLSMAREVFPNLTRYNLAYLAKYLRVDSLGFHRALEDALVVSKIFFKIKEVLKDKGVTKIDDLLSIYGLNNEFLKRLQEEKLSLIKESISNFRELKVKYLSYSSNLHTFNLKPKELVEENNFYIIGTDPLTHKELRLNINRILNLEIV